MDDAAPIEGLSFEAALKRLEAIVQKLEAGDTPLESSIDLYSEGQRLKSHCEQKLEGATARIEAIQIGMDGRAAGLKPLDPA